MEQERIKGTVKWYSPKRKYGFIQGEDGEDYFVHKNSIKESMIYEQDIVSFIPSENERGGLALDCEIEENYESVDANDVKNFLKTQQTNTVDVIEKHIICKDDFVISIQASAFHSCVPRCTLEDRSLYTHVEVMTSEVDSMLYPYSWDATRIYFYVPIQMVQRLINKHGGIQCISKDTIL